MLFLALAAVVVPILAFAPSCDIKHAQLVLPANQSALTPPASSPLYIASAIGVQNYTCNATSLKYVSAGAVAELFDISCLYGTPQFDIVQDEMYTAWSHVPSSITIQDFISALCGNPFVLGQHYFVPNPIGASPAILPKWDFTSASQKGNPNAYVVATKVGNLKAPTGSNDVDWLQLKSVAGGLAKVIYRVNTKAGQPPSSCTPGSSVLSVKYSSKYWFY